MGAHPPVPRGSRKAQRHVAGRSLGSLAGALPNDISDSLRLVLVQLRDEADGAGQLRAGTVGDRLRQGQGGAGRDGHAGHRQGRHATPCRRKRTLVGTALTPRAIFVGTALTPIAILAYSSFFVGMSLRRSTRW